MSGKPTSELLQQYRMQKRQSNLQAFDSGQGVVGDFVDSVQQGLYEGAAGIAEFVGADSVRDWASAGAQAQNDTMSRATREALQKPFFEEDDQGDLSFGDGWTDPRALVMQLGRVIGMNADIVAGGAAIKGGKLAATSVYKGAKKKMLAKGASPDLAEQVAKEASKTWLEKTTGKYANTVREIGGDMLAYGAAGHAVSGGLQAIDIRDEVAASDFEDLAEVPEFQSLVLGLQQANPQASALEILEESRRQLGEKAAQSIKTNPTLLTANMLVGGLGTTTLMHILRGVVPKGAGIATEIAVEGTQGAMEQVAMNQEAQHYLDPERGTFEGAVVGGLNEAVMGGAMGATAAGTRSAIDTVQGKLAARKAPAAPKPDASILPVDDAGTAETEQLLSQPLPTGNTEAEFYEQVNQTSRVNPEFAGELYDLVRSEPEKLGAAIRVMDNYVASPEYRERAEQRLAMYQQGMDPYELPASESIVADSTEQDAQDFEYLHRLVNKKNPQFADKIKQLQSHPGLASDLMARYLAEPDFQPIAESRIAAMLDNKSDSAAISPTNVIQDEPAAAAAVSLNGELEKIKTYAADFVAVDGTLPDRQMLVDTFDISEADADQVLTSLNSVPDSKADTEATEPVAWAVEEAAQQAALSKQNDLPEPTAAQKEAGNYKKGKVKLHGLEISIENPRGSDRTGVDPDGREWSVELQDNYGYIRRTKGADNEQVDVFIGSYPESDRVFVVDQVNRDGTFDEHKVILGASDLDDAVDTYSRNYESGWVVGPVTEMSVPEFKNWLKDGDTKAPLQLESPKNDSAVNGQTVFELRDKATDEQISSLNEDELRVALKAIGGNRFKGLDNVSKDVVRHVQKDGEVASDDMRAVLLKHRDYWIERNRSFAEADAKETENMERRYGGLSLEQLERESERLRSKVGQSRQGDEVNDGRRSSVKATSNEAARSYAEEEMQLRRYIDARKQQQAQEPASSDESLNADPALVVEDYSEKSLVVRGDTKAHKAELQALKGVFNPRLKGGAGWVFGKKRESEVRQLVDDINQKRNTNVLQSEADNVPDTAGSLAADGRDAAVKDSMGDSVGQVAGDRVGPGSSETTAVVAAAAPAAGGRGVREQRTDDVGAQRPGAVRADNGQRGVDGVNESTARDSGEMGNIDDAGVRSDNRTDGAAADVVEPGITEPVNEAKPLVDASEVASRLTDYLMPQFAKQVQGKDASAHYLIAKALIERPATKTGFNRSQPEYLNRQSDIPGYRALTEALNNVDPERVIQQLSDGLAAYVKEQEMRVRLKNELDAKKKAQLEAETVPYKAGDESNIKAMLPYLDPLQQDDVVKAESRLYSQNQKGMLLANGTGTGKTFSGGGVIKRAIKRGAKRVLVVSPAGMTNDWQQGLKALNIESAPLTNTNDAGTAGVVALTSYENFYQNRALLAEHWELVVYDESHKLMGNMQGDETQALDVHRMITRYSDYSATLRARTILEAEAEAIRQKIDQEVKRIAKSTKQDVVDVARNFDAKKYWEPYEKKVKALAQEFEASESASPSKTLFLSASPFATHKALFYMDRYVFDSREGASNSQAYNTGSPQDQFLVKNLGYSMRYNKPNRPGAEVDVGLLERELADKFVAAGGMSIRRLDVEKDYSREFVRVNSAVGEKLQQGFDLINAPNGPYRLLAEQLRESMKGGKDHELLEGLRAKESVERIKQHLALGRKVIVFHERQQLSIRHPFRFPTMSKDEYMQQLDDFKLKHPELYNLPLTGLQSVPDALIQAFGRDNVALFSGKQTKKQRQQELDDFKNDAGGRKILVVQKQAGKEGLSPHDVTGKYPRALMIMNTPVSPTDLIQMEGRVYRRGLASNAIIELPTIGTRFEQSRYRDVVSSRTGTAENLAMGSQARDLRNVLRESYLDPRHAAPDTKQGTGGKAADSYEQSTDMYERAKTYYWKRQKKNAKTKSAEGADYFATPEPIGLKLVEFADIQPGDKALEPSGGHGAIARWMPEYATNTAIELSGQLSGELAMVTNGRVIEGSFYDHYIVNKYHSVVMNPPFGHAGADALKFLEKGFGHLYNGGRMVAIVPRGAMDAKFEKWYETQSDARLVAEILLPALTFNRAGTSVQTRVLIIDKDKRGESMGVRQIDLSQISDEKVLFDRFKELEIKGRPDVSVAPADVGMFMQRDTKDEQPILNVSVTRMRQGVNAKVLKRLAERFNGELQRDRWGETEYHFTSDKDANRFFEAVQDVIDSYKAGVELDIAPALGNRIANAVDVNQSGAGKGRIKVPLEVGRQIARRFDSRIADSGRGTFVVSRFDEFPKSIVDLGQQRGLQHAKGFLFEGRVYINLEHIESVTDLQKTLVHERLRHYGLRKVFGTAVFEQLQKIYLSLGESKVKALAKKYGVDVEAYTEYYQKASNGGARLLDEVIAHIEEGDVPGKVWTLLNELRTRLKLWVNDVFGEGTWAYQSNDVLGLLSISQRAVERTPADLSQAYLQPTRGQDYFDIDIPPSLLSRGQQATKGMAEALQRQRVEGLANMIKPNRIWAAIKLKWPDLRPAMLALLPRNYLGDIAGRVLPSLDGYNKQVARMESERNQLINEAHTTADSWRDLAQKNRAASEDLADLMHEATLIGVDPSLSEYKPVITEQIARVLLRRADAFIKSRNGEAWAVSRGLQRRQRIKDALEKEPSQREAYEKLRQAYLALPSEYQQMFTRVRDDYRRMNKERETALANRIQDLIADKRVAASQIAMMQEEFELNELSGIYFPLQRFGKYRAVAKDAATGETLAFSMFETNSEMQKWLAEQQATGAVTDGGYQLDFNRVVDGVGSGFMKDLLLQLAPIFDRNDKLQDEVYQLFLQHSPDLSMRKHMIHRKGVKGFDEDALRAYAHNMFHGAYQVAKLKHTHHMQSHLMAMEDEAKGVANTEDKVKATQVVNEMQKRNDWILNPQSGSVATKLTGFGFFWYLGTTPAAALVNITQTPMIGLPVLGSRYGFRESAKALLDASKSFMRGRGHLDKDKSLAGHELAAFKMLEQSGIIDKTMAHDVTGIADGGVAYSPRYHKVMKVAGFMFHHAERFNREVTAMAAYRLAFKEALATYADKPANIAEVLASKVAVDKAMELVTLSHFNYANSNRARVIQSDAARVLLLFRQHSINMTYRLIRDFQQSFWGAPAERAQARKQLAGILGIGLLFSGAAGLPLYSVVAGIFNTLGGDEDEPFNFDVAVRQMLGEAIGETAASLVMNGTAGTLTGADLTSRIGYNNLWFREPDATLEGEAVVQYYAEQALGPIFGIATGVGRGLSLANQGDTARAWEAATPKFVRDWLRSVRFAQEGVLSRRGDAVIDELSPWQIALQANGFTPLELSEQYRENSALKTAERLIMDRRQLLMNRYALGKRLYDGDLVDETLADIERFNEVNPAVKITAADRLKSLQRRREISQRAVNGVVLNPKLAYLAQ